MPISIKNYLPLNNGKGFARTILEESHFAKKGAKPLPRILVIDDQHSIRTILSMLLTDLGYNVEVAENGEEGIRLYYTHGDFDLVITDIRMPRMDGNEVARCVRNSDRANTPLVAITGFPEEAQMDLFDCTLVKPFKLEALRNIVTRFKTYNLHTGVARGDNL